MRFGLVFDNVLWSKPLVSLKRVGEEGNGTMKTSTKTNTYNETEIKTKT